MINWVLTKIFGTRHEREMRRLQPIVAAINDWEPKVQSLSDQQLQAKTIEFREKLQQGAKLDDLLIEAFAVVREAARRVLNLRHYDVQLIGGIILHEGKIAEMKTGEGKTLVATLPAYLNALTGKGVHIVTVNDYLAKRDAQWMGQIYRFLGLEVGVIVHDLTDAERKKAYAADITYATNNELGFDYLRDNMKYSLDDMVQRTLHYAIIDECDSILIDEARTPLIISGPSEQSSELYIEVNKIVKHLQKDVHFKLDEKTKNVTLTDEGNIQVEKLLGLENLYDPRNILYLHHVIQAIRAHWLYHRDVDYVVKDNEVIIVDEFTGRLMPGRRWSDGLHQAIEAKEGVPVKSENQTLASITFQNYFRLYQKIAGMTGTAETEAAEFKQIYNLDVVVIPTHKPVRRIDRDDVVYKNEPAKWRAILKDIQERYQKGQPILVGTVSIEKNELLSRLLSQAQIPHQVLNAKHHEREAQIIAQAGRYKAVTIATNMAGRGTDILLGGNPEGLAFQEVGKKEGPEYEQALQKWKQICEKEKELVIQAGGLYVIGTERHESRRIDNQLRGRSGRQGDPGESRFYLSLEDPLMRIFNGEVIQRLMDRFNVPDDEPITAPLVTRSIESAQKKVEAHNFEIRKHLLEYDDVLNKQRIYVYDLRKKILQSDSLDELYLDHLSSLVSDILDNTLPENVEVSKEALQSLSQIFQMVFNLRLDWDLSGGLPSHSQIVEQIQAVVENGWRQQLERLGPFKAEIQKMIYLQVLDQRWKQHLFFIDRLREGIGLRGYAQKDPLVEYKRESFAAFERVLKDIQKEVLERFFKVELMISPTLQEGEFLSELERHNPWESARVEPVKPFHSLGQMESTPQATATQSIRGDGTDGNQRVRVRAQVIPTGEPERLNRKQRRQLKRL